MMRLFLSFILLLTLSIPNALAVHHYILSESHFACNYSEKHIHEKVDDCVIDNYISNSFDFSFDSNVDIESPREISTSIISLKHSDYLFQTIYYYSLRGPPVI